MYHNNNINLLINVLLEFVLFLSLERYIDTIIKSRQKVYLNSCRNKRI